MDLVRLPRLGSLRLLFRVYAKHSIDPPQSIDVPCSISVLCIRNAAVDPLCFAIAGLVAMPTHLSCDTYFFAERIDRLVHTTMSFLECTAKSLL